MSSLEQGVALLGAGRFHEALQQFGAALREQPTSVDARIGLSQAAAGSGDPWAAAAWMSDACRVAPQRVELWIEVARMLSVQQREAELEPLLQLALTVHPTNVPLLHTQADLDLRRKQYARALPRYAHLYALQAKDRAVLLHYGYCLEQTGDIANAAALYREAIAREPHFLEAHVDLAGVLWRLEDFDGALAHARKAVELAPQHAHAVRMLGSALLNFNRADEAVPHLERALQLQPGFALAEIDLAFAHLMAGRLAEGWAHYARRWLDSDRITRPSFYRADREWQGPAAQPLQGKRIAVYGEQGLGDVIQCIRYAPMLQAQGATVFAIVQPELVTLVEHSMPGVQCLTPQREFHADLHVALMDLPMHLGTTLQGIPASVPYLKPPAGKVSAWRERLAPWKDRLKVGLAWCGSPQHVNNNNRSMPLSELQPLMEMQGVQCFSLQKGDAGDFSDIEVDASRLVDFTGEWSDFSDSAAMVENLDLVIAVDTAVAHLAGAMSRPVWMLLPPNADWRWLLDRDDSPWYPTMRVFRRAHGEARAEQVARMRESLLKLLAGERSRLNC